MSDDYQIDIPPSFIALFLDPGKTKPNASREHIAARYELCEDLATMLTQTAGEMQFKLGIAESDVLQRVHQGLQGDAAVVEAHEAQWVVCRLAELMGWPLPVFPVLPLQG